MAPVLHWNEFDDYFSAVETLPSWQSHIQISQGTAFSTLLHVRHAEIKISRLIHTLYEESLSPVLRKCGCLATARALNTDSDQPA